MSSLKFPLNLYKSKESQTDTCEKEDKNSNKTNNFLWQKLKKLCLPEKPDCILKNGSFVRKYFMSLYGQTCLKKYFWL